MTDPKLSFKEHPQRISKSIEEGSIVMHNYRKKNEVKRSTQFGNILRKIINQSYWQSFGAKAQVPGC